MKEYKTRIADQLLANKLEAKGAVLVQGAKWCGKTTTAERCAKSILYMADPNTKEQNLRLAEVSPLDLLKGESPRLIDEWQLAPNLWDTVRYEVDHRGEMGQFILTGSAVPPEMEKKSHSGTGRFSWLTMRPMSLYESGESSGVVSLENIFENPAIKTTEAPVYSLDDIIFLSARGGWPVAASMTGEVALEQAQDYLDAVVNEDISRVDGIKRDANIARVLMRSYARHQGTQATYETIAEDVANNEGTAISRDTIVSYLSALRKLFVVEDAEAWNPNLRSKTSIRTTNTRYFVDPSIAVAALGATPEILKNNLNLFGFIFETLCIRDLRVYCEALGASTHHYRDRRGLECDAVITMKNGDFGLIEIKLGGETLINEGANKLNELEKDLTKKPKFKMILTATERYAYQRQEDGILVVPITCLGV